MVKPENRLFKNNSLTVISVRIGHLVYFLLKTRKRRRQNKFYKFKTTRLTSAQVVETSVTNNSSFQNYTSPDDHNLRTTDTPGFKGN